MLFIFLFNKVTFKAKPNFYFSPGLRRIQRNADENVAILCLEEVTFMRMALTGRTTNFSNVSSIGHSIHSIYGMPVCQSLCTGQRMHEMFNTKRTSEREKIGLKPLTPFHELKTKSRQLGINN